MASIYKVDKSDPQNRIMRATKSIQKGALILESMPLACFSLSFSRNQVCQSCFEVAKESNFFIAETYSKCSKCRSSAYCSQACQKKDWAIHKLECPIYAEVTKQKYNPTNIFALTLRIFIQSKTVISVKMLKDYQLQEQIEMLYAKMDSFNEEKQKFIVEMSYVLLRYIKNKQDLMSDDIDMEELVFLQNVICKIMVNSFTIQNYFYLDASGAGIYAWANFINSHCKPNAIQIFIRNRLRVIALRTINPEEEITICYDDVAKPQAIRHQFLKENYHFDCSCGQEEVGNKEKEYQRFTDLDSKIYNFLAEKKFDEVLPLYKEYYQLSIKLYNGVRMPQLGWKYYEKFKLLLNKGDIQKGLKYGVKAREVLEFYFKKVDKLYEMEELEQRYFIYVRIGEIQAYLAGCKDKNLVKQVIQERKQISQ